MKNLRPRFKFILGLTFAFYFLFKANIAVAKPNIDQLANLPKEFFGNWRVQSVRTDLGSSRTLNIQWDDPTLLGKRFQITENLIVTEQTHTLRCHRPN